MDKNRDRDKEPEVADARRRIAQASFRLFGERGYSCTSIQDIADAAGVRKAMVYYYFSSKEGLYQALVDESSAGMRDMLTQVLLGNDGETKPEQQNAVTQLEAVAELVLGLARDNRDSVRFFLSHLFAADADRPACSFEETAHTPPNMIQQIAARGVRRGELRGDAGDLTRLLIGAIQVSVIRYVRTPDQEPLAAGLGRRLVRALLRGFAPDRPAETASPKRNARNGLARSRKSALPSASTPSPKSSRNHRA